MAETPLANVTVLGGTGAAPFAGEVLVADTARYGRRAIGWVAR